jgi:hypothetical protein
MRVPRPPSAPRVSGLGDQDALMWRGHVGGEDRAVIIGGTGRSSLLGQTFRRA